ncbi:MAG: HAD-IA family hydrolase [Acidobacteriota bacterium]
MQHPHDFQDTRTILFDLDGTLIDTTELILQSFAHTWQSVCGYQHSRDALLSTFGIPLREAMRKLLIEYPAETEAIASTNFQDENGTVESLLATYRHFNFHNHDTIARPFAHTREVVSTLRARGYRLGVVTSKGRELARRGLQLCSINEFIEEAVFLEDTTIHKPRPEPILLALEKFKTEARHAVYVGDSFHDMIAGRTAGVKTIAAAWGPMPRRELEREAPDFIAESMNDLLEIFH